MSNKFIQSENEFYDLIQNLIIKMIEGEDNFFGQFLIKVKRGVRRDIKAPIGTIPNESTYNMYFNPELFLKYSKDEMIALIKHEIYHIMYNHYERSKSLRNKYNAISVNIALDISINQYIKNMPMDAYRIDNIAREYDVYLKEDGTVEEYAEIIDKAITKKIVNNEEKDGVLLEDAHSIWSEIEQSNEEIKYTMKKNAISSAKGVIPSEFAKILSDLEGKAVIEWQGILKKILPHLRGNKKKTITRRNRRQPERMDLRGTLPDKVPKLIVAIDISASISEGDYEKILTEILEITKYNMKEILVIECDDDIRRIYKIKGKNDIKKREKNSGATRFTPVFEYINKNSLYEHGLIYFTDGVGEKELGVIPKIKNIIWVLIGNEKHSLVKNYGFISRINEDTQDKLGRDYAINLVKENIHDWAR